MLCLMIITQPCLTERMKKQLLWLLKIEWTDDLVTLSMTAILLLHKTRRSQVDGLLLAIRSLQMITASTSAHLIHDRVTIISSSALVLINHLTLSKSPQQA